MDSTGALVLDAIPPRLLVIGGGIIGLEMATVYAALGSKVSVVELMDGLIPGCDRDLVKPLEQRIRSRYESIRLSTKVTGVVPEESGLRVSFEGPDPPAEDTFDRGPRRGRPAPQRRPDRGRKRRPARGRTRLHPRRPAAAHQRRSHLRHRRRRRGRRCSPTRRPTKARWPRRCCAGRKAGFDALAIPSVAYTDPEVAWTGLTETAAREQGVEFDKATFPWAASGRARSASAVPKGLTKVIFDRGERAAARCGHRRTARRGAHRGGDAGDRDGRGRARRRPSPSIPTRHCRKRSTSRRRWPRGRSRTSTCRVARSSPATSPVRHTRTHGWRQGEPNPRCEYGRFDRKASIERRMHPHPQRPARTRLSLPAPPSGTATRDSSREATGKGVSNK